MTEYKEWYDYSHDALCAIKDIIGLEPNNKNSQKLQNARKELQRYFDKKSEVERDEWIYDLCEEPKKSFMAELKEI